MVLTPAWHLDNMGGHVAPAVLCARDTAAAEIGPFSLSCAADGQYVTILQPGSSQRGLNDGRMLIT